MFIFKTPKNWCVLQLKSQSQFTLATDGFHREISAICSAVHVTLHQPTLHPRSHFFNRVLALRNPCRITWLAPPSKYTINMLNMWKNTGFNWSRMILTFAAYPLWGPRVMSHALAPCSIWAKGVPSQAEVKQHNLHLPLRRNGRCRLLDCCKHIPARFSVATLGHNNMRSWKGKDRIDKMIMDQITPKESQEIEVHLGTSL